MQPLSGKLNTIDGRCLHFRAWGDPARARIVLIHGFGQGGYAWSAFVRALRPDCTVIGLDLSGHGDSDWRTDCAYDASHHAHDVAAALNTLDLREVVLIGHSLGAEVALRLAEPLRKQIRAVVLMDGGPDLNAATLDHLYRQFCAQPWIYPSQDAYAERLAETMPLTSRDTLGEFAREALRRIDGAAFELKCDPALRLAPPPRSSPSLWTLVEEVNVPTLLVRGAGSAVLSPHTAERIVRALPNGSLVTVPCAGHAVLLDNPSGSAREVHAFLSQLPVSSAAKRAVGVMCQR